MKKRIIAMLGVLFTVVGTVTLVACGSDSNTSNTQNIVNNNDNIKEKAEEKQKYVIELNMDNYLKYIDVRAETATSNSVRYAFYGSLSYAFYDNVVVECERTYSSNLYPYTVELSAGGYGLYYTSGYGSYEVKGISGKVIYWI